VRRLAILLIVAASCGCTTVGPDYQRPENAVIAAKTATGPFVGADNESFATEPPPGAWWQLYRDPTLDGLIQQALAANTDLRVASATIARAEASLDLAKDKRLPSTSLGAAPSYTRLSPQEQLLPQVNIPPEYLYSLGASLSYQVDLFGQIRRAIEAAQADVAATRAAYDTVRITVVAETTRAYADACSAGREIGVAEQSVALQARSTELTERRFHQGRGISLDVTRAAALEDRVRASIPPLQAARRIALYRLAVLTGRPPAEFSAAVAQCAQEPLLNKPIPIGDGSALLARRPDVRRAEYTLHAATAQVGVVTADLYPKISLGIGAESIGPTSAFLDYSSLKYSIGSLITWEFPNRRVAQARVRGAQATVDAAFAQFDGTVLAALRETESALVIYARDLDQRTLLEASRREAATAAGNAETLFRLGGQDYLTVLDANIALIAVDQSLAALSSKIADDQVNLFLALGGGWGAANSDLAH
jgi:outer membrane protein, multidrug efflux system